MPSFSRYARNRLYRDSGLSRSAMVRKGSPSQSASQAPTAIEIGQPYARKRASSILGPLTYGIVTWGTGGNHRLAILLTGAFFVAALVVLFFVDERRGRKQVE